MEKSLKFQDLYSYSKQNLVVLAMDRHMRKCNGIEDPTSVATDFWQSFKNNSNAEA